MSNDNNRNQNGEGRGFSGVNVLFFAGLIALVIVVGYTWYKVMTQFELAPHELKQLVEHCAHSDSVDGPLKNPSAAYVDLKKSNGKNELVLRFSNIKKVQIGDRIISGSADVVEVKPKEGSTEMEEVAGTRRPDSIFHTAIPADGPAHKQYIDLFESNFVSYVNDSAPNVWSGYLPAFVLVFLIAAFLFVLLRRLNGAGSPMSFGRSKGRLYAHEDLGVTFNDVAGIDEAVDEVREVVDFLRSPEKYQRLGGRIPKGVLLVGPPGTGKTLLAKAIAGEAGVPFFSLSGSDFVEMFVGVGAARVRDMFQQAESKAPCIIFIDELDALGKSRGSGIVGGHDEREQTLNALLVEMDGFGSNSGVIVMAATNRPETLDQALLRPGRFDRHVLVDRPDIRGREDILKVHVKAVKLDPLVDLREVAAITPGFVGADLANLVNEAALLAARKEKQSVGMDEFNDGVERVTAGLEKKQRVMNEDEKRRVAYHESGHALVAYSLPNTDPVHKVSIIPRGLAALGYTMQRPEGDRFLLTQSELESRIQVLLAGTITEEIIFSDISTGAQNDLERATEIARSMVMEYGMSRLGRVNYRESNRSAFLAISGGEEKSRSHSEQTAREIDQEVKRILDESIDRVRHILETRRPALEALTKRLIEVESVDAAVLKRVMEENTPGPTVVPGTAARSPMLESSAETIAAVERSG